MLRPCSRQRHAVVDPGLPEWGLRRLAVAEAQAVPRNRVHVRRGNGGADKFPHEHGASDRGLPQPMFLYLTPAAASTLPKGVSGCLRKGVITAVSLVQRLGRAIQQDAGQGTVRGFPSQYLETFGRRVAEEIALAIVEDVAKASGKTGGNLKIPVALERVCQGFGSLLVVARGVGSALREPFPVAPHVQAPVWSVAHLGHPSRMSGIVPYMTDNVNATPRVCIGSGVLSAWCVSGDVKTAQDLEFRCTPNRDRKHPRWLPSVGAGCAHHELVDRMLRRLLERDAHDAPAVAVVRVQPEHEPTALARFWTRPHLYLTASRGRVAGSRACPRARLSDGLSGRRPRVLGPERDDRRFGHRSATGERAKLLEILGLPMAHAR